MSRDRAEWVEVAALVARAASVHIDCALRDLPRVAPLLTRDSGNASAQFRFYRMAAARSLDAAHCEVRALLALTCQRCLAEVSVPVEVEAQVAFVDDEASVTLVPESHDPVVMEAGRVSLAALVEEELLLAMPIVPMHADPVECGIQPGTAGESGDADVTAAAPRQTPFAGLRDLMKK